jgi:hypothetical protein
MTDNKFIERRLPPRREDLTVDELTDLVKYNYATMARAIAELQCKLAELAGTGKLDPQVNHDLQWRWCLPMYEGLYYNTVMVVRRMHDTSDCDWNGFDNTSTTGRQVRHRKDTGTLDDWEFNEHLADERSIVAYPRNAIVHIAEPPLYATKGQEDYW